MYTGSSPMARHVRALLPTANRRLCDLSWLPKSARCQGGPSAAALLCVIAFLLAPRASAAAALYTQTLQLQSGWNAVYLEVSPTNPAPESLFSNLPLDSAWDVQERLSSVDFIQDINEPVWNRDRWAFYVPTNRVEARANRLFAILGFRPYLLKLTNAATWTVTGRPAFTKIEWVPDAYNFRGFPIDPSGPPTFQAFFGPSPAHYTSATGQLQPMYRLSAAGQWTLVTPSTQMKSGEAYWIFCKGGSDYQGPMEIQLESGRDLDFGLLLDVQGMRLFNRGNLTTTFAVSDLLTAGNNPLLYQTFNPSLGYTWVSLPPSFNYSAMPGTNLPLRLAIRRAAMTATNFETVLQFRNGAGVRHLVPVVASTPYAIADASPQQQAQNNAGLWIGSATITAVSEAHSGELITNGFASLFLTNSDGVVISNVPLSILRTNISLTPRPVKSPAELRLLLHVDNNGTARLLKEVIQMWQDGSLTNDADGTSVAAEQGRYVLVTDDAKISQFKGAVLRDGQLVGRRFSTIAYDFPVNPGSNYLVMSGLFAISNTLNASFTLPANFPTNPFRHKYHPDHNDLNESYSVSRAITLQVSPPPPNAPPDYGSRVLNGVYGEVVGGLHKTNIVAAGTFTLRRVCDVGILDR